MFAMVMVGALLLDRLLGEPRRYHPLVYFGRWASALEQRLNRGRASRMSGVMAYLVAVLPPVLLAVILAHWLRHWFWLELLVTALILYSAIGWRSLSEHARAISQPLRVPDLVSARQALARIVSRDTGQLTEREIAKGATESVLENGADAIFSALFWFLLLGIPGVVLYRLSNTLDAMWGYKTERWRNFGWCAARVDDLLNYLPARLTAMSYALMGHYRGATHCWQTQGGHWKSPNAGPVMAAGAGALQVSLGGAARYHGQWQQRPLLGPAETAATGADADTIDQACQLITRAVVLWCVVTLLLSAL